MKAQVKVLGCARGIDRRRFGDETGLWHLVVEEPGEFLRAVAACGKPTAGQLEPLDGNVCSRCEAKAKKLNHPVIRKPRF